MKISDMKHAERMAKRTAKRASLKPRRRRPEPVHEARFIGDGCDKERIERAERKRQVRAER